MVSVPARREAVAYATGRGLSQRRACTLLSVARSALDYRSRKPAKDAPVLARMGELRAQYPRYGYRRIRDLSRPRRSSDELRAGLSAVAGGRLAGAAQAPAQAHRDRPAHGRRRRRGRTRCGPTTSCSTGAPTASSSSA